jgi:hypothetical protein
MLMYEKNGKLILNFQKGSVPAEVSDVQMYKESDVVHVLVGDNDLGDTTKVLSSISVKGFKTTYSVGDKIDLTGTTVTAKYDDGSTEAVTTYTTNPDANTSLTAENTSVVFSYTAGTVTKTTTKTITVS